MSAFRRTILTLFAVLLIGGALFLMTWNESPPIQQIEMTIPDSQLPR